MVRIVAYGAEEIVECEVTDVSAVHEFLGRFHVTWVNVDGLGDVDTIRALGEAFDIHHLALEDVVNVHQRAKIEEYGDLLFVVSRMPFATKQFDTEQLSLFLGRNFVLTFQERQGDCLEPLRDRLRKGRGQVRQLGPDYLAYAILDAVVDSYFPIVERSGDALEEVEDEVARSPSEETLGRVHRIKRDLLVLRRSIWPLRDVLSTLARDATPLVTEETGIYLRDCHDHTVRLIELVETYREVSSDLAEAYITTVSNRLNEIMKVLTVIATIFIPLSVIAGIYGMNFNPARSPWNMPELNWRWGYLFALAVMATTALAFLVYFRRKGWIGSRRSDAPEPRDAAYTLHGD